MTEDLLSSTHPQLPPTTEDERLLWLRLLRSRRVGPATFTKLMAEYHTVGAALAALPKIAKNAGLQSYTPCPQAVAIAEMRLAQREGAQMLTKYDRIYPRQLAVLADAPPLMWGVGDRSLLSRPMVAIVGARNASSVGCRMAAKLAHDLGKAGYVIVSGLARGIDTAAHEAALDTGTIAVVANGVDITYPKENKDLANKIRKTGLYLSEQMMGQAPKAQHFPARNRIVSGMAHAVIVVEAAAASGTLITARTALDQGREVMAVPGHPMDPRAIGCNQLLADGARIVRHAEDVLEALPPIPTRAKTAPNYSTAAERDEAAALAPPPDRRSFGDTAALHSRILDRLSTTPISEDQLIRDLHAKAQDVAPALLDLELDGKITRRVGGLLSRGK